MEVKCVNCGVADNVAIASYAFGQLAFCGERCQVDYHAKVDSLDRRLTLSAGVTSIGASVNEKTSGGDAPSVTMNALVTEVVDHETIRVHFVENNATTAGASHVVRLTPSTNRFVGDALELEERARLLTELLVGGDANTNSENFEFRGPVVLDIRRVTIRTHLEAQRASPLAAEHTIASLLLELSQVPWNDPAYSFTVFAPTDAAFKTRMMQKKHGGDVHALAAQHLLFGRESQRFFQTGGRAPLWFTTFNQKYSVHLDNIGLRHRQTHVVMRDNSTKKVVANGLVKEIRNFFNGTVFVIDRVLVEGNNPMRVGDDMNNVVEYCGPNGAMQVDLACPKYRHKMMSESPNYITSLLSGAATDATSPVHGSAKKIVASPFFSEVMRAETSGKKIFAILPGCSGNDAECSMTAQTEDWKPYFVFAGDELRFEEPYPTAASGQVATFHHRLVSLDAKTVKTQFRIVDALPAKNGYVFIVEPSGVGNINEKMEEEMNSDDEAAEEYAKKIRAPHVIRHTVLEHLQTMKAFARGQEFQTSFVANMILNSPPIAGKLMSSTKKIVFAPVNRAFDSQVLRRSGALAEDYLWQHLVVDAIAESFVTTHGRGGWYATANPAFEVTVIERRGRTVVGRAAEYVYLRDQSTKKKVANARILDVLDLDDGMIFIVNHVLVAGNLRKRLPARVASENTALLLDDAAASSDEEETENVETRIHESRRDENLRDHLGALSRTFKAADAITYNSNLRLAGGGIVFLPVNDAFAPEEDARSLRQLMEQHFVGAEWKEFRAHDHAAMRSRWFHTANLFYQLQLDHVRHPLGHKETEISVTLRTSAAPHQFVQRARVLDVYKLRDGAVYVIDRALRNSSSSMSRVQAFALVIPRGIDTAAATIVGDVLVRSATEKNNELVSVSSLLNDAWMARHVRPMSKVGNEAVRVGHRVFVVSDAATSAIQSKPTGLHGIAPTMDTHAMRQSALRANDEALMRAIDRI
jgi:hypothetical protein